MCVRNITTGWVLSLFDFILHVHTIIQFIHLRPCHTKGDTTAFVKRSDKLSARCGLRLKYQIKQ